jgi:DNA-binding CsgD family transcriptional regulator
LRRVAQYHLSEIAVRLKISRKTIEAHRSNVMKKLEADSIAEVVRLALAEQASRESP